MATIVKFYKDKTRVKEIVSIGYLPVDTKPQKNSKRLVTSGAVKELDDKIEQIGKPLQWKGPATVEELNAGIEGIQPGWTYTLTDAGTLTDGSVAVDVGDEVAWTEDDEWFPLGGESKIAVFYVTYPIGQATYPDPDKILDAINAGKFVVIDQPNVGAWYHTEWLLEHAGRGAQDYVVFVNGQNTLIATRDNTAEEPAWQWTVGYQSQPNIAPDYGSLTFPIAEGTKCIHNGFYYVADQDIATSEDWTAAHWTQTSVTAELATIGPNGVFIGSRKIHPGTKLFVEGLPVDGVDYALVEKYNAFIYNRITALATSGTVTLGLWNYDSKTYVSEQQLSTDSDNPTVIDVSAANASDTMEIHLKGTGVIDSIVGSIV